MKAQKGILTVMGIVMGALLIIGCSSNPTSSTATTPNENYSTNEAYYTTDEPCSQDHACQGNEATATSGNDKTEIDDSNDAEPQPVYPL